MANGSSKSLRRPAGTDKRGGYLSSSKQVSKLITPPRGPAPGASTGVNKTAGQK